MNLNLFEVILIASIQACKTGKSWPIVKIALSPCLIISKSPTDAPTVARFGVRTECAKVLQIVCRTVDIPVPFAKRVGRLAA